MTEDEFLTGISCTLVPATLDGKPEADGGIPIQGFRGLYFRPLDVADMEAIREFGKLYGREEAWRMTIARSIRSPDGSRDGARVISDAGAEKLKSEGTLAMPIMEALTVIRRISGQLKDESEEKKTLSTAKDS